MRAIRFAAAMGLVILPLALAACTGGITGGDSDSAHAFRGPKQDRPDGDLPSGASAYSGGPSLSSSPAPGPPPN